MSQLQSINVGVITTYLKLLLIDELVRRKGDLEYDVQVALLERTAIDGHAFVRHCFHRARFDDLTGRVPHDEIAPVEMLEREVEAAKRLCDADRVVAVEVVALALEQVVLLLL